MVWWYSCVSWLKPCQAQLYAVVQISRYEVHTHTHTHIMRVLYTVTGVQVTVHDIFILNISVCVYHATRYMYNIYRTFNNNRLNIQVCISKYIFIFVLIIHMCGVHTCTRYGYPVCTWVCK